VAILILSPAGEGVSPAGNPGECSGMPEGVGGGVKMSLRIAPSVIPAEAGIQEDVIPNEREESNVVY